jgi:hypothetical protein
VFFIVLRLVSRWSRKIWTSKCVVSAHEYGHFGPRSGKNGHKNGIFCAHSGEFGYEALVTAAYGSHRMAK